MTTRRKLFVLYDGRAKDGDTDRAAILVSANNEAEARKDSRDWRGYGAIWYEYDVGVSGGLESEIMRPDLEILP